MQFFLALFALVFCSPNFALADDQNATSKIEITVEGKLIHENNYFMIIAKNDAFTNGELQVQLIRTEDKNQKLDTYLNSLEGKKVTVKGHLSFMPDRIEGPTLGIPVTDVAQILISK